MKIKVKASLHKSASNISQLVGKSFEARRTNDATVIEIFDGTEIIPLYEGEWEMVKGGQSMKEYPPLLSASHVAEICSCCKTTAYEIMRQPHRPRWNYGKVTRLHRDLFFDQLAAEAQSNITA